MTEIIENSEPIQQETTTTIDDIKPPNNPPILEELIKQSKALVKINVQREKIEEIIKIFNTLTHKYQKECLTKICLLI